MSELKLRPPEDTGTAVSCPYSEGPSGREILRALYGILQAAMRSRSMVWRARLWLLKRIRRDGHAREVKSSNGSGAMGHLA